MSSATHLSEDFNKNRLESLKASVKVLSWGKVSFCDNFPDARVANFDRNIHAAGAFSDVWPAHLGKRSCFNYAKRRAHFPSY